MCKCFNGEAAAAANPHRLPDTVTPESYDLLLSPDLAAATFSGEVNIKVNVHEPVSEIVLNALDLNISEAIVRRGNGTAFKGTVVMDEKMERAHIKVNGTIGKGDWQVLLRFTGTLNDKLRGFYRSTYKDASGVEQVIATTQFQATDARRCFPCFDEPAMKATFKVTMVIDKDLTAVSNGAVTSITFNDAGKKVVSFEPTIEMSTYIVAFVVGKLVSTKPVHVDGIDVRMWCVPGKEHLATFALEAAQFSLRYFRKYFGVPYPMSKMDLLAIPDFAAGAMENMGCITFRENVLVDPATASQAALDWAAKVTAHEVAHMWFGNLVTMDWWEGIWLNESFATFMETKCTDALKKDWKVWDKFGRSRSAAFLTDALRSTRPIEFTVVSPDDAQAMFDVLTYEKGCSVMRMLEQYLGEETFRRGIAAYIKKHCYGNTVTGDLWAALEQASGQPVREIMQGWIFRSGFPVLSVERSQKAGCVVLKQQPFKFIAGAVDETQRWMVPVMLRAKVDGEVVETKHLLKEGEETIYLGENLEWVVVNAGGHGFYRTLYHGDLREKLTADVQNTLTVIERVNLLGDAWSCVQAGISTGLEFIGMAQLFADETDPNVWGAVTGPLSAIQGLLPRGNRTLFEALVCDLVRPALDRLGWEATTGESSQTKELRGNLLATLGLVGNLDEAYTFARDLYERWKKDRTTVDGDLIGAAIKLLAERGDAELYEEFYARFKNPATPQDEERFRSALAGFDDDQELIRRTLDMCMNPKEIRTQDAPTVWAALIRSDEAGSFAWNYAVNNWDKLRKLYPDSGMMRLVTGVVALNTVWQERQVRDWFELNALSGVGKQLDQVLERQHINVLLAQRETAPLFTRFASQPQPAATPAQSSPEASVATPADDDVEVVLECAQGAKAPPTAADAAKGMA